MPKPRTEEQFPLLLVLVGDQDVAHDNKRLFGRGRFDGITSGASAIITEWPNYLSSCWLTALICGLTLFSVSIMLTSCLTFQHHTILPRCSSDYQLINNKTIHLVHTSHQWNQNQLDLVANITKEYPNYQIHLLIVTDTSKLNHTNDDFLQQFPNILVTNVTYREIFEKSPLFLTWGSLNPHMKLFAARVLQLWQFGGLSYDLLEHQPLLPRRFKNCTNFAEKKIRNYIRRGSKRFGKLPSDVVSVDQSGFHMECKTPCHAFFGKVLMKLKKINHKATPRNVLSGPMFTFCRAGAVDREFCHIKALLFQ